VSSPSEAAADPAAADPAADPAVDTAAQAQVPWERLSVRSLAVRPAKDFVRVLPVLIGLVYAGSRGGGHDYWGLGIAALTMVTSIWRWFNTRYRVTADRVYVRRGLLNQKVLSVARDSVRSVDLSAHVIYRVLGVAEVKIGTGRNDRHEGENFRLDALAVADAEALRATLLATSATRTADVPAPEAEAPEHEIARLSPGWIRFAPMTLTGLVILGVLVGTVTQVTNESDVNLGSFGPVRRLTHAFAALSAARQIGEGAGIVLLSLVVVSVLGYIAVFWNFRLTRQTGDILRVTRGLLSTRATTIDTRRLRGVEISEPLLLRAMGGARCIAITTGLRVGGGAERGGSLLLPPAPRAVAHRVAAEILDAPADLCRGPLIRHGRAARRRRYTRALISAAVIVAAAAVFTVLRHGSAWIWTSCLALFPLLALVAADRYRSLGHLLRDGRLVARTGSLVRRRSILSLDGVVGWDLRQSWFQRRQALATLTAATAAGRQRYRVQDLPMDQAVALALAADRELIAPFLTAAAPTGTEPGR
jgi:putative membrane protein